MKTKCQHQWKEVGRHGTGNDRCIERVCAKCGEKSELYPDLLRDIFSIRKEHKPNCLGSWGFAVKCDCFK